MVDRAFTMNKNNLTKWVLRDFFSLFCMCILSWVCVRYKDKVENSWEHWSFISIFLNQFKVPQGWKLWSLLPVVCQLPLCHIQLLHLNTAIVQKLCDWEFRKYLWMDLYVRKWRRGRTRIPGENQRLVRKTGIPCYCRWKISLHNRPLPLLHGTGTLALWHGSESAGCQQWSYH